MKDEKDWYEYAVAICGSLLISFWGITFIAWSIKFCIDVWKGLF